MIVEFRYRFWLTETQLLWIRGALRNTWSPATQDPSRSLEAKKARNPVPLSLFFECKIWPTVHCVEHSYQLMHWYSCAVGKGGVKFIVHWLDHIIYPVLMQILCVDALEVVHEMDKVFFRNKWEYAHGMALEQV